MSNVQNSAHRPDGLDDVITRKLDERPKGVRRREWFAKVMGGMMGPMSHQMITLAEVAINHGSPRLVAAVDANTVKVHVAAILAKLPHDEQDAALDGGKDAINAVVRRLRPTKPRRFHGARREALNVIEEAAAKDAIHFVAKPPDDTDARLDNIQRRMRQTFAELIEDQPEAVAHVLYTARKEYEGHYWLFVTSLVLHRLYSMRENAI